MSSSRLQLARFTREAQTTELEALFRRYGKIKTLTRTSDTTATLEYEHDVGKNVVRETDGKELSDGSRISVSFIRGAAVPAAPTMPASTSSSSSTHPSTYSSASVPQPSSAAAFFHVPKTSSTTSTTDEYQYQYQSDVFQRGDAFVSMDAPSASSPFGQGGSYQGGRDSGAGRREVTSDYSSGPSRGDVRRDGEYSERRDDHGRQRGGGASSSRGGGGGGRYSRDRSASPSRRGDGANFGYGQRDDGRRDEGRRDDGRRFEGGNDRGRGDYGRNDQRRSDHGRGDYGRNEQGRPRIPSGNSASSALVPLQFTALATISTERLLPIPEPMDTDLPLLKPSVERERAYRPDYGTLGRRIKVYANSFRLSKIPQRDFYQWDVQMKPETTRPVTRKIFEQWMRQTGNVGVTDAEHILWTVNDLGIPAAGQGFEVVYVDKGRPEEDDSRRQVFQLTIKFTRMVGMAALKEFIGTGVGDVPQVAVNVLQLICAYRPNMTFTAIHKATQWGFYKPYNPRFNLSDGLTLGEGWKQSVKATMGEMILTIDMAKTAFYPAEPLHRVIAMVFNKNDIRGVNPRDVRPGTVAFTRLSKFLRGLNVKATHMSRGYRIKGLSHETPDRAIVKLRDGGQCTVTQYFEKTYAKRIQYPDFPCIDCSKNEEMKILIPMEFLVVKEGQRHIGKLSDIQTQEVIKFTAVKPDVRRTGIAEGRETLNARNSLDDVEMRAWGVELENKLMTIDARVLPPPTVNGAGGSVLDVKENVGLDYQHSRDFKFYRAAPLPFWSVAVFGESRGLRNVEPFFEQVTRECQKLGIQMARRNLNDVMFEKRRMSVEETLNEGVRIAIAAASGDGVGPAPLQELQVMVFCIMVGKSGMYDEIKFLTRTGKVSCVTQCILSTKHFGGKMANGVGVNFAQKINKKMGGLNTIVEPSRFYGKLGDDVPTMVMGAAMTHPGAGVYGDVSNVAVVGSIDNKYVEFRSVVRAQAPKVQSIADLEGMAHTLFQLFYTRNRVLPKRIIFLRTGVSDGQMEEVSLVEINALKRVLNRIGCGDAKITFVIVNKRHMHRFFPVDGRDGDRNGNCKPGTVIDSGVTHPSEFDFFLFSHQGIQGTSRATHYQVILDQSQFRADELQQIIYASCWTYGRANKSVSLAPAAYYACLAAEQARYHRPGGINGSESGASSVGLGDSAAAIAEFQPVSAEVLNTMYWV
ncbi:hypothetical protein HDU79_007393 [Rhizoclosmatium sp. JEL0117]|nr:hypothetical protein HDU79_007393 [Rhizoclosmatium sp. JEL0117]